MPKKILLAEDDLDDREFFYEYLHRRKDLVLLPAATDGELVMKYLENTTIHNHDLPDVIILDQNMPRQNGLQTLELLKKNTLYSGIPVMVYTTYASDHLIEQSLEMGAIMVVSKPSDEQGYHLMINKLLEKIDAGRN